VTDLARAVAHLEAGDWQAAHVIVHLLEGDADNARYWYRRAKRAFPAHPDPRQEIAALHAALKEP
jgi:hypothetical protein